MKVKLPGSAEDWLCSTGQGGINVDSNALSQAISTELSFTEMTTGGESHLGVGEIMGFVLDILSGDEGNWLC